MGNKLERLKSCPFCKGEVYITKNYCFGDWNPPELLVYCDRCGLHFGYMKHYSEKEIIKAWNSLVAL
jgi:hypothetical protein